MAKKQRKSIGKPSSSPGRVRKPGQGGDEKQQQAMQAARHAVECLNRQDLQNAVAAIDHGLQLDPKNPDLLHLAGQAALYAGETGRGIELIRQAIKLAPKVALYHYNLGNALAAQDDLDGALEAFRRTVRLEPTAAEAFANLGIVFVKQGRQEEAAAAFSEAARLQPNDPETHLNLAICNMELLQSAKAAAAIKRVEELVTDPDPGLLHKIGNIYRGLGQHLRAEEYYRSSLEKQPDASHVWFALGDVLSQAGENDQALVALAKAEDLGFHIGLIKYAHSRILINTGDIPGAKELLAEAELVSENNIGYLTRIAHLHTLIGDFEAQERCLKRVLELDPKNVGAFSGLAFAPGRKVDPKEADSLRSLANDKAIDSKTRIHIAFALGDFYRYKKKFDESFRYYKLGNQLKGFRFDRVSYSQWLRRIENLFTADFFEQRSGWGNPSRLPLLIVGMPRSGTTLTEQIVSSHPEVHGAGEYGNVASLSNVPDLPSLSFTQNPELTADLTEDQVDRHAESYLAKMVTLAEKGERVVANKMPHNFQQLGLFGLLFPNAPVIHIKRDPRDNLLSIFFKDFAGFHTYAYDLRTLGLYYRLYERLMDHWAAVIPNPVYQLQYEDLVADLPGKTAELAEFVGVDLDQRMLRFWEQDRKVETASKWQVRQPVYTSSVGRWKPYEKHLGPMLDALGPVAG